MPIPVQKSFEVQLKRCRCCIIIIRLQYFNIALFSVHVIHRCVQAFMSKMNIKGYFLNNGSFSSFFIIQSTRRLGGMVAKAGICMPCSESKRLFPPSTLKYVVSRHNVSNLNLKPLKTYLVMHHSFL